MTVKQLKNILSTMSDDEVISMNLFYNSIHSEDFEILSYQKIDSGLHFNCYDKYLRDDFTFPEWIPGKKFRPEDALSVRKNISA